MNADVLRPGDLVHLAAAGAPGQPTPPRRLGQVVAVAENNSRVAVLVVGRQHLLLFSPQQLRRMASPASASGRRGCPVPDREVMSPGINQPPEPTMGPSRAVSSGDGAASASTDESWAPPGTRVLVVDDEADTGTTLRSALGSFGYDVSVVANGEGALEAVTRGEPDAVILDLMLPDMSGLEVCRSLRAWSNVPIIVMSARTDQRTRVEALDGGADDYVMKPFEIGELEARVRSVLRRAEKEPAAATLRSGELEADQMAASYAPQAMDFMLHIHSYAGDQIKMADAKASLMAATAGLLFNALGGRLRQSDAAFVLPTGPEQWVALVRLSLGVTALVALVTTLIMVYQAVRPRLTRPGPSRVAFLEVARAGRVDYVQQLQRATTADLVSELARNTTDLAAIAVQKNAWLARALWPLLVAALIVGLLVAWP